MWKKLYKSLEVTTDGRTALPKPTAAQLDQAEATLGAKLPRSYRAFAQMFGLGEHSRYFRIYVPLKGKKYAGADLATTALQMRTALQEFARDQKERDFCARMIPFADTIGGDVIVFDPKPPRGGKASTDYPVFILVRGREGAEKLSPSFAAFVEKVAYGTGLDKVIKSKEKWIPEKKFLAFGTKTRGL